MVTIGRSQRSPSQSVNLFVCVTESTERQQGDRLFTTVNALFRGKNLPPRWGLSVQSWNEDRAIFRQADKDASRQLTTMASGELEATG